MVPLRIGQDGRVSPRPRSDSGSPRGWSLSAKEAADGVVIAAIGEFDVAAAPELRRTIRDASLRLPSPARVVVDLSKVSFLDAAVLGVFVTERKALQRARGDLVLDGVTPWSLRIIEICGLRETLGV